MKTTSFSVFGSTLINIIVVRTKFILRGSLLQFSPPSIRLSAARFRHFLRISFCGWALLTAVSSRANSCLSFVNPPMENITATTCGTNAQVYYQLCTSDNCAGSNVTTTVTVTSDPPSGSGKEAALPPLPPLRTERESFPSFGSSRCKAPLSRSRFT